MYESLYTGIFQGQQPCGGMWTLPRVQTSQHNNKRKTRFQVARRYGDLPLIIKQVELGYNIIVPFIFKFTFRETAYNGQELSIKHYRFVYSRKPKRIAQLTYLSRCVIYYIRTRTNVFAHGILGGEASNYLIIILYYSQNSKRHCPMQKSFTDSRNSSPSIDRHYNNGKHLDCTPVHPPQFIMRMHTYFIIIVSSHLPNSHYLHLNRHRKATIFDN